MGGFHGAGQRPAPVHYRWPRTSDDDAKGATRTMDKARKGTSSRTPPQPSDSHAEIDDWMRRAMPDLQPMLERLDQMIRETLSDTHYAIKWKKAYYGVPDHGWVIEVVAYDVSVNVVFLGGADFDDPPPLGDTDRSRYIKLKSVDEMDQVDLPAWIENAGRVPGWT
jgi:hypothetical protein